MRDVNVIKWTNKLKQMVWIYSSSNFYLTLRLPKMEIFNTKTEQHGQKSDSMTGCPTYGSTRSRLLDTGPKPSPADMEDIEIPFRSKKQLNKPEKHGLFEKRAFASLFPQTVSLFFNVQMSLRVYINFKHSHFVFLRNSNHVPAIAMFSWKAMARPICDLSVRSIRCR
jgi:hypothetical protein